MSGDFGSLRLFIDQKIPIVFAAHSVFSARTAATALSTTTTNKNSNAAAERRPNGTTAAAAMIARIFPPRLSCLAKLDPSVKKLLGWKLGDEEEKWALKAVESLIKKLRKRKTGVGTVDDLEFALAHPGLRSKCVTIPRSLDGRLQVSHRKGLPHVIYCRVWRWPTLQSHHEIKSIADCHFPYDNRTEHICINPYHYQRVDTTRRTPPISPLCAVDQRQFFHGQPMGPMGSQVAPMALPKGYLFGGAFTTPTASQSPRIGGSLTNLYNPNAQELMDTRYSSPYSTTSTLQSPSAQHGASPSILSDDDEFVIPYGSGGNMTENNQPMDITPPKQWSEPDYWCTICYYELNSRVGEPFKLASANVVVDGFTDPTQAEERICLGLLSNVNRNVTIENTRKHIGRGVRFVCTDSLVTIFNSSESPIFVQSRNSNFKYNLQSTAVCRVPAGTSMVVFDYQLFHNMLEKAQAEGYHHVYELQKMCFIRMSFVKGWGADYHRQDVTSTPCWLEIQLHQPLSWIDAVISPMDPPEHLNITSVS